MSGTLKNLIPKQAQQGAVSAALNEFKASLNDPKKLAILLKDIVFKIRFEKHFDILCLPKGAEQPNHDYAILYRQIDKKGKPDQQQGNGDELQAIVGNLIASNHLPVNISYRMVRKEGIIYSAVYLDIPEDATEGESS